MNNDIFRHVCNIEQPISHIRGLMGALNMIAETLDETESAAVFSVVWAALTHITEIDTEYSTLFRLTHSDRERFDREGWPTDQARSEGGEDDCREETRR
jgi:hypothetical protein